MGARNRLTAKGIASEPPGKLQDGGGLILEKRDAASGKWIYRYSLAGRRREMGLGGWPEVSLAQARALRDRWAECVLNGTDPIAERARLLDEERARIDRRDPTLSEAVAQAFEARKARLRGDGTRGRWLSPLQVHVLPQIGKRRITSLHQRDLHDALAPIWRTKHTTAEKAIQRLRIVFEHAQISGAEVDPVTVDRARQMLGHVDVTPEPIPAVPWQRIPELWQQLVAQPTTAHFCLRWLILTAVRQSAGRGVRLSEIDGDIWTIPADRIKGTARRVADFRVPLSPAALALVQEVAPGARDGILFPGQSRRGPAPITDTATQKALRNLGWNAAPHGFRTSFRTWVQDTEAASYDVAETALGHVIGGRVERAYARSDLLERRRVLMCRWADFVTGAGAAANVVPLRA
ncbi:MAG: tyrosine-type recombinase/integrase [Gemmobacter sp.]|uniref:tyrosine-type recombinase/integrase n=1 Tax=Gemmobacter sp. TaxID=1898957 RepID=UPI00391D2805